MHLIIFFGLESLRSSDKLYIKRFFSESNSLYMYMYINLIKYNVITLLKIGYETKNF